MREIQETDRTMKSRFSKSLCPLLLAGIITVALVPRAQALALAILRLDRMA